MGQEKAASKGIRLGGMIFIVFLILKLAEIGQVATWSWWWVTSPLWLPILVILGFVGLFALITFIIALFSR